MAANEGIHSGTLGEENGLLPYLRIIRKHWKVEVGLFLAACLITGVISLLLPKQYEGTASVLLRPESGSGGMLEALLSQTGGGLPLGGLSSGTDIKDVYVGILKSRTMQDEVIKRFDLVKVYGLEDSPVKMTRARAQLKKATDIKILKEAVISVTVEAPDPRLAADMANLYVDNLDRLNTSLNTTDAGRSRQFLEGRVADAQEALRQAENRLKDYQSKSRAVVLEGQTKAAIEGAAMLEGQILAAEVQLKTLQTFSTERNPDVIRLKEGIEEMRRQLKRMEYGRQRAEGRGQTAEGAGRGGTATDFMVPLGSIPATGLELVRLIREAKIQETIFTVLTQQLEQAKIAEAKDTPTVKILDRAVVPEWKSRPKVLLNTALAGLVSIVAGVFLAFSLEYLKGIRRRERAKELTAGS